MFSSDRVLTLDIGAGKIVLGEFSIKNASTPILVKYASRTLSPELADNTFSAASFAPVVKELMLEADIKPAPTLAMLSGQLVFPRFVKLPAVAADRIAEMVYYEAEQNLPFPIDEVMWDYQTVGDSSDADTNVLIFAAKTDVSRDVAECVTNADLDLELIDAAPLALYNSIKYNYPDAEGCIMALDIGARSTNLIFIEGNKIFTRSIPIAGNTITNEIARSLSVTPTEAEAIKKRIGFVALGGTYAVVDDETTDKVSKVIRNVVTRLYTEVTRSINFYKTQQGGNVPERIFLTGGASLTQQMDTFFREKFNIEIEYLNPFVNVAVSDRLQLDNESLFLMAASTGLALRKTLKCPVEINLMPSEVVGMRRFRSKIPYFIVAVFGVVITLVCWYYYAHNLRKSYTESSREVQNRLSVLKSDQREFDGVKRERDAVLGKNKYVSSIVASKNSYHELLKVINGAMLPDTWLVSLSMVKPLSNNPGDKGGIKIMVRGFKQELDDVASRKESSSPAEKFLTNLLKSKMFLQEGSSVEIERAIEGDRISEIVLSMKLSASLGIIDENWIDEMGSAQ